MSVRDAAHDISLADYESWGDAERIVVNVNTLYREYDAGRGTTDTVELFDLMAEIKRNH